MAIEANLKVKLTQYLQTGLEILDQDSNREKLDAKDTDPSVDGSIVPESKVLKLQLTINVHSRVDHFGPGNILRFPRPAARAETRAAGRPGTPDRARGRVGGLGLTLRPAPTVAARSPVARGGASDAAYYSGCSWAGPAESRPGAGRAARAARQTDNFPNEVTRWCASGGEGKLHLDCAPPLSTCGLRVLRVPPTSLQGRRACRAPRRPLLSGVCRRCADPRSRAP
jgi:hypothetical protein